PGARSPTGPPSFEPPEAPRCCAADAPRRDCPVWSVTACYQEQTPAPPEAADQDARAGTALAGPASAPARGRRAAGPIALSLLRRTFDKEMTPGSTFLDSQAVHPPRHPPDQGPGPSPADSA